MTIILGSISNCKTIILTTEDLKPGIVHSLPPTLGSFNVSGRDIYISDYIVFVDDINRDTYILKDRRYGNHTIINKTQPEQETDNIKVSLKEDSEIGD